MPSIQNHVLANLALHGMEIDEAMKVVESAKLMVSQTLLAIPQDWGLPIDGLNTALLCQLYITVGKAYWHLKISQVIR